MSTLGPAPDSASASRELVESLELNDIKARLKLDLQEQGDDNQNEQNRDRGHGMDNNLGAGITPETTGVSKGTDPVTQAVDEEEANSPFNLRPKPPTE